MKYVLTTVVDEAEEGEFVMAACSTKVGVVVRTCRTAIPTEGERLAKILGFNGFTYLPSGALVRLFRDT